MISRALPLVPAAPRMCRGCGQQLVRRAGEKSCNWQRRTCCGTVCRAAILRALYDSKHTIPCVGCGKPQVRSERQKRAACRKCVVKRQARAAAATRARHVEQARRYRIIMHVLGWPDEEFAEALRELKASPLAFRDEAETRSARYDLALERKARRRAKGAA